MQILPNSITELINEFSKLPSIGPKSAERLVFYLLAHGDAEQFGQVMMDLKKGLRKCSTCKNYASEDLCPICQSSSRSPELIAVVSNPMDIVAI